MKLRTVLISVVVSAALIGGAGYGAYYVTQNRKSPVEVVPVSNVSMGYYAWDQQETIYGSITSQVAQTVRLDDEYGVDKIFVKVGDKVKEGTPLFSYDMTLQELELEMQQLELQTNELTMTRLEKELEKLKNTPATASLERDWFTLTASAEEPSEEPDIIPEEASPESSGEQTGADGTDLEQQTAGGIEIDNVEKVEGDTAEPTTAEDSVLSFERLVLEIHTTFLACGDQLKAEDVGEAIEKAVAYYRKNLAEEKKTEEQQADGFLREIRSYVLKDAVRDILDKEEIGLLEERCETLDEYQVKYVEMLISEAEDLEASELSEAVAQIEEAYDLLASKQQDQVKNLEEFERLKELSQDVQQSETQNEGETAGSQESGSADSGTSGPQESESADGGTSEPQESESADGGISEPQESESQDGGTSGPQETEPKDENSQTGSEQPDTSEGSGEQNTVTFDVAEGAVATVAGQDVTNSFAIAEEGRIVFTVKALSGYEITEVLMNGTVPVQKDETTEEPDDYVIEGIQTNDTIVSVRTRLTQDTGTPGDTQPPSQTVKYTVTINPGNKKETYAEGDMVPLQADLSNVTLAFTGWSVAPDSEENDQKIELNDEDVDRGYASFIMPGFDVTATARYQDAPDAINSYVNTFLANAEKLLAGNAEQIYAEEEKDFLTELESAIVFYQQWLSLPWPEVQDATADAGQEMEKFQLLDNVSRYLTEQGRDNTVLQLTDSYRELCLLFVKTLFQKLDPAALDKTLLEKATTAYALLGEGWRNELEKRWEDEQAALAEQLGQPWKTNKKGKRIRPDYFLGIGDTLSAYSVMQLFQDYLNLPPETPESDRYSALMEIWSRYLELNDAQKTMVSGLPLFIETFKQYGLWEDPEPYTEPETEFPDYGGYDDFGDMDDGPYYTAEELREMIQDKEQEIKSCALDIRQSELDVRQKQRIVDGKIVKSTMDGTVISIGGEDGESDEDYFVKVASEAGLFAKGSMNELSLEKIHVGDTISGMLQTNGVNFTAVVKEISEYPDSGEGYYGQGNSNASYYSFYALIDDNEDMEEGDAEIYLTSTAPNMEDSIYLENYFVRSEPDGRTYVFKEGDDGRLTKQYVTTGKSMYGYAMEIVDGLELTDSIAFPYGKNVVEGAKVKEVDALKDALM